MRKQTWVKWAGSGVAGLALLAAAATAAPAAERPDARPWLGVSMQQITSELREGLDYDGEGVLVNRVVTGGPAERAGVRKGDVLTGINSRKVASPEDLQRVVEAAKVGQTVTIQLTRDGARRTVSAKLAAWPEGETPEWSEADQMAPGVTAPLAPRGMRGQPRIRIFRDQEDGDGAAPDVHIMMAGRGRLGVMVQDLKQGLGEYFGVKDDRGALVNEVVKDTPAERAGLKAGDVITRLGDDSVNDTADLLRGIRGKEGKVQVTVVRKGTTRSLEAELEKPSRGWQWFGDGDAPDVDKIIDIRRTIRDQDQSRQEIDKQLRELRQELSKLRDKLEELNRKSR